MPTIFFYHVNKPYGCLSNFSKHPVNIDGRLWPTTEHFFQARKFINSDLQEAVRAAATPMAAAEMGCDRQHPIRPDWETVRIDVMLQALRAKFTQHETLREVLLSTGHAKLVEHTANDGFWADGGDGSGQNQLGKCLMKIRNADPAFVPEFYVPPWIKNPDADKSDLIWRLGAGEDYLNELLRWLDRLGHAAKEEYRAYYPKPDYWQHEL